MATIILCMQAANKRILKNVDSAYNYIEIAHCGDQMSATQELLLSKLFTVSFIDHNLQLRSPALHALTKKILRSNLHA